MEHGNNVEIGSQDCLLSGRGEGSEALIYLKGGKTTERQALSRYTKVLFLESSLIGKNGLMSLLPYEEKNAGWHFPCLCMVFPLLIPKFRGESNCGRIHPLPPSPTTLHPFSRLSFTFGL